MLWNSSTKKRLQMAKTVELVKNIENYLNEEIETFMDSLSVMSTEEIDSRKDEFDDFFNSLVVARSLAKSLLNELRGEISKAYGVKVIFPSDEPNEVINLSGEESLDSPLSDLANFLHNHSDKN